MTPLRDQLQAARLSYDSAAYPGNLADELLPPAVRPVRRWAIIHIALGGALAAATVLAVVHRGSPSPMSPMAPVPQHLASGAQPTPLAYPFPDRMSLTLPAPLVAVTPPVTVSFSALNNLGQQQYEQIGPLLRQRLSWPGLLGPAPKSVESIPGATTQQAV